MAKCEFYSVIHLRVKRQNKVFIATFPVTKTVTITVGKSTNFPQKVSLTIVLILKDFQFTLLSISGASQIVGFVSWKQCWMVFFPQLSVAEQESEKVQQYGMIQELLRESNCLREELHNLRCLTRIKVDERGQKHREMLRAEVQHTHAIF